MPVHVVVALVDMSYKFIVDNLIKNKKTDSDTQSRLQDLVLHEMI